MEVNAAISRSRRDAGLAKVVTGKGAPSTDDALVVLSAFLATIGDKEFIWEEFRAYALAGGFLNKPKSPNWWGAVCMLSVKAGLIRKTGNYAPMKSTLSHARITPLYVRA